MLKPAPDVETGKNGIRKQDVSLQCMKASVHRSRTRSVDSLGWTLLRGATAGTLALNSEMLVAPKASVHMAVHMVTSSCFRSEKRMHKKSLQELAVCAGNSGSDGHNDTYSGTSVFTDKHQD